MISFGSNVGELILRNTLWENTRGLNSAVERMTSGYKLNHAGDNAAGHFMVTDLSTQISSMLQVQQNTEDGLAMLQIAGGGLENIKDLFERLRDLSTQASNDSYDDAARESMQAEADAIIEEINRIQQITQYNGESLFGTPKNPDSGVNRIAKSAKVHNSTEGSIETQSINNIPTSITSHKLSSAPATAKAQNTKAAAAAASTEKEEGAVDFAANETKTIEIDGVEYEITNQNATANSISYIKDLQTGQITMFANNLTIRAQEDTAHDIILQGRNNTIYGGDLADRIEIKGLTSINNYIYGGAGDDTLINPISWENYLYGEDGNDTLEISAAGGAAYGGNGDDIFNMSGSTQRVKVYGGTGNDTFNLSGSSTDYNMLYGQEGEDIFNIGSGSNDNLVDGGSGTNSITDNGPNTIKVNVPGANYNVIDLAGNETKEITINGIKYTVRNRNSTDRILAYSVEDDGSIKFKGDYTDITGEANKAHKVILDMYGSTFRGGNLADNITITGNVDQNNANTIYGGAGNDIIKSNTYSNTIFGGDGDDTIEAINKYNRVYGESGNDNITIKSISSTTIFNGLADGGAGDDTITIDSNVNNYVVNGGSGSNTLIDNGTNTLEAGFNPDTDTGVEVVFNGNETKVITINGIDYTIKNNSSYTSTLVYSYNPVTGEISFGGYNWIVHGDENKSHNIIFYAGNSSFYGGNLDDKIVNYGVNATIYGQEGNDELINQGVYATMYGDNGNDTITANVAAHLYAGAGDDIININTAISNRVVNGGTGNDTYNLNKYANVVDEGGDNIYNIYADNASVSGSTGNDTFYVI